MPLLSDAQGYQVAGGLAGVGIASALGASPMLGAGLGALLLSDERLKRRIPATAQELHSPIAAANRAQAAELYAYQRGAEPPGQQPAEPNIGPMAQRLEHDPVGSTAVRVDPSTGVRYLDSEKLTKLHSAGIAELQRQNDMQQAQLQNLSSYLAAVHAASGSETAGTRNSTNYLSQVLSHRGPPRQEHSTYLSELLSHLRTR